MTMPRAVSSLFWLGAGAVIALAGFEFALRALPVSTGLPRTEQAARWPLQNANARYAYTYSTSWAMLNAHRGTTNNYGHVAPFDFERGSAPIIVVGDSYVESLMNRYDDSLQSQLSQRPGVASPVYGLGASGLSASGYVAMSKLAQQEFRPAAAVFVFTDGDISESLVPTPGSHHLVLDPTGLRPAYQPPEPHALSKRMRELVGDIAIYRYFQINLQFSVSRLLGMLPRGHAAAPSPEPARGQFRAQQSVIDWTLTQLPESLGLPAACIVLLLDSDRYAIYKPSLATQRKDEPQAWRYLADQAKARGFQVADLEPVFRREYERHRSKFDHWPIDRHWNRVGHSVAADEAYRLLYQTPNHAGQSCFASKRSP